jgi:hypothetical protein
VDDAEFANRDAAVDESDDGPRWPDQLSDRSRLVMGVGGLLGVDAGSGAFCGGPEFF